MKKSSEFGKKIKKVFILIISLILAYILLINFVNCYKLQKKIEVKEAIREFILSVEKAEANDSIEFNNLDTIRNIENEKGEKLEALKKYSEINNFSKIENLTLEDARKIINNEVDFTINKEGYFFNIENKTE